MARETGHTSEEHHFVFGGGVIAGVVKKVTVKKDYKQVDFTGPWTRRSMRIREQ